MTVSDCWSEDEVMWLNLEVGSARSLRRRCNGLPFDIPSSPDPRWYGRRALVVEAADTYLPEAGIPSLPALAAAEIADGLSGRLRTQIASSDPNDPELSVLRDDLITALGGAPDVSGALSIVDRVYARRLLRNQVPGVVSASCVAWYGCWRTSNGGPALATAQALQRCVTAWTTHPDRRPELDTEIVDHARALAGDQRVALEDLPV